jgi:RNA polymerase sigma-70 factor (ECF subfamily)
MGRSPRGLGKAEMQLTNTLRRLEPIVRDHAAEDNPESALIRASMAGDEDAFAALVRRHERRVFRLASRFFRRPQDVEEVAQETFLRAWLKLSTFRSEAPFENWLTRLCMRCAYDRLRRLRHTPEAAASWLASTPAGAARADGDRGADGADVGTIAAPGADPDARLEVERLLAHLQPADRFLLVLLEGEGWSVAEIARRLGWSEVNVKVRAHRARKRLRRVLEEG